MEARDAAGSHPAAPGQDATAPAAPRQAPARPPAGEPGRPAHPIRPAPALLNSPRRTDQTRKESAMYDLPSYVWALVLIGVIGIPAITCLMLYRGAMAAGLSRRTATTLAGVAAAGTLLGLLAATRIPVVARILAAPGTPARLALPHTLRVVGVTFLLVMAQGRLPAIFALPAGLGDIAAGLAAPFVARRLAHGGGHIRAVWFNLFGILDLVVALSLGFLAGLGPWRPLEVTPSTEPLSLLPLALVPTVAVPLALALHLVSLSRLHAAARPEERKGGQVFAAAG